MKSAIGIWEVFVDTNVVSKVDRELFIKIQFVNQMFEMYLSFCSKLFSTRVRTTEIEMAVNKGNQRRISLIKVYSYPFELQLRRAVENTGGTFSVGHFGKLGRARNNDRTCQSRIMHVVDIESIEDYAGKIVGYQWPIKMAGIEAEYGM
ncbi:hypothetical protein PILCRDRAFT_86515 [Piloderma croceum F 1598]|uniref:Uncharacterized protein n=1 Tax=Piloderma croceum (strain F 1598) TaxID=765440 RepID=A0A0C3G6I5_PILCF|nr:hypothetical protein PILCRDRAFT_86515 [Piloderma croceum F 1598]